MAPITGATAPLVHKQPVPKVERGEDAGRKAGEVRKLEQQFREIQVAEASRGTNGVAAILSGAHTPVAETTRAQAGAVVNPFNLTEMAQQITALKAEIAAMGVPSGMAISSALVKSERNGSQSGNGSENPSKSSEIVSASKDLVDARLAKSEKERKPIFLTA